jgi:hypothetical protein
MCWCMTEGERGSREGGWGLGGNNRGKRGESGRVGDLGGGTCREQCNTKLLEILWTLEAFRSRLI